MQNSLYKKIEFSVIYEVAKILTSTIDTKESCMSVLNVLDNFLDMGDGTITIYNTEKRTLEPFICHGSYSAKFRSSKGMYIPQKVTDSGSPIIINDINSEPTIRDELENDKKSLEQFAYICVPVKESRRITGTLSVTINKKSFLSTYEDATKLLTLIASLIAQSLKLSTLVKEEKEKLKREKLDLENHLKESHNLKYIIGKNKKIFDISHTVERVAPTNITVLVRGESGTGKELIAKAIHFNSKRSDKPFIKINCTALPESLLEAELFGYVKGAFTGATTDKPGRFEIADKGTIFLDEIGDMPITTQVKLLRVLQDKKFERLGSTKTISSDVRIIAATNKDLEDAIDRKMFREDLYYRLNVVPINIPPLRERKDDIYLLLKHFVDKFNSTTNKNVSLSPEAVKLLYEYHWPGNIREMENVIHRVIVLSDSEKVEAGMLPDEIKYFNHTGSAQNNGTWKVKDQFDIGARIEDLEKEHIIEALKRCGWVKSRAAKLLGITARQLDYRIQKYSIRIERP